MTRGHGGRSSGRADYLARPVVHVDIRNRELARWSTRNNKRKSAFDRSISLTVVLLLLVHFLGATTRKCVPDTCTFLTECVANFKIM